MWRNKNGESDWQHSFGSEELTTSTYVRGIPDYLQKLKVPEILEWNGYRIILQKLKLPEVFPSDPCEKERAEKY